MTATALQLALRVRTRGRGPDAALFAAMAVLVALGVVVGWSAAYPDGADAGGRPARTLLWAAIGLGVYFVAAGMDYRWLRTLALPAYVACLLLLAATLVVGRPVSGAQLSVSLAGIGFQFSELAKVILVVVLADHLGRRGSGPVGMLGAAALTAAPLALVMRQPDLGTAVVLGAILAGMLFLAGAGARWLAAMAVVAGGALWAAAPLLHEYQRARFECFLDPGHDPAGACYQLVQGLAAVAASGWTGSGLTAGVGNQLDVVPAQGTDFVFTVVAEEMGLAGALGVLALFALLVWRILAVAWRAPDALGTLIGAGVASLIAFQVIVSVGMVVGLVPVTGIPLPFITYGGSSLVSAMLGLGIVQSVARSSDGGPRLS